MGITKRREREKEEVRKKILDAARELFCTFLTPEGKEKPKPLEDNSPGGRSFGHLLAVVTNTIATERLRRVDPLTAAEVSRMGVPGVATALTTWPPEGWPHGAAAADLVDQVIDNGRRGFLAKRAGSPKDASRCRWPGEVPVTCRRARPSPSSGAG